MRALSLSQPWAHVVVHGPKRIENRPTALCAGALKVRGQLIAIHAAKSWDQDGAAFIAGRGLTPIARGEAPAGAVIGVATIADVFQLDWARARRAQGRDPIPEGQWPWAFGPLCILLEDVRALTVPLPCRGMLGFWTLPADVESDLVRQLAHADETLEMVRG